MKLNLARIRLLALAAGSVLVVLASAQAANIQKLDDSLLLTDPNAWSGTVVPGAGDVALWNGAYTVTNRWVLGASTNWAGISLGGPLSPAITIGNDGNTLTLGSSGISINPAANNLTVNCPLTLGAAQAWSVTNGLTLTVNGPVADGGGNYALTKAGGGTAVLKGTNTYTGPTTVSRGTLQADFAVGLPQASSLTLNGGELASISGLVTNALGSSPGQIAITGGASGFSALGTNTTVALGGVTTPSQLVWGGAMFNPTTLILNDSNATANLTLEDGIDLGGGNRTISVATNSATLVGQITNSAATYQTLTVTGNGNLTLSNIVTFAATNINYYNNGAGTLTIDLPSQPANLFGQFQNLTNGTMILNSSAGTTNYYVGAQNVYGPALKNDDNGSVYLNGGTWVVPNLGQNNGAAQMRGSNYISNCSVIVTNSLRFTVGNYFLQNGGNLIMPTGDRVEFAVSQTTSGQTYLIDLAPGSLMNIASCNFGFRFGGGTSTTSIINQHGGNVLIGVQNGSSTANRNLYVDFQSASGSATYNLSGGSLSVAGTISASYGSAYFNFTGGSLTAAAFNTANFANMPDGTLVNNGGTLAPGGLGVAGTTAITGNYSNSVAGTLSFDLGGTTPANSFTNGAGDYDYVSVSGTVALGGTLGINLINGYTPAPTSSFTVISAGTGFTAGPENFVNNYNGYVPVAGHPGVYMQAIIAGSSLVLTNYGVTPPALAARFSPTNVYGVAPYTVTFADTSSGAITNRHWVFGDSSTLDTSATSVAHTYTTAGNYPVTVTVTDASGATSTKSGVVHVVTTIASLTWKGDGVNNVWDTGTLNWLNGATPAAYAEPDSVTFDDTGSAAPAVSLNFLAQSTSVTFNNSAKNYTIAGTGGIDGNASVTLNGSGTVTLLTANPTTGPLAINSGSLQVGNGTTSGSIDQVSAITDYGALAFNQADNHTLTAPISGYGSLTKAGGGTLTLTANNSGFSGPVTNRNGTLAVASDSSLGGGPLTLNNATLTYQTAVAFSLNRPVVLEGTNDSLNIGGAVTLAQNPGGSAAVTLGGSGTLQIDQGGNAVTLPASVALNGASIVYDRYDNYTQPGVVSSSSTGSSLVNTGTSGGNTNTLTLANGINVFDNFYNNSSGVLALNGSINSSNYIAGTIGGAFGVNSTIAGGDLDINGGNYFVTNAPLFGTINGGTFASTIVLNGGSLVSSYYGGVSAADGGARFIRCNLIVNGGTFHVTAWGLGINDSGVNNDPQHFTVNGGTILVDDTSTPVGAAPAVGPTFYGLVIGSHDGANSPKNFGDAVCVQNGGSLILAGSTNNNFDLGCPANSPTNKVSSYTLNGGLLSLVGGINGGNVRIGGSADGASTGTLILTNTGKLVASGSIFGYAGAAGSQVFSFLGGTLVAGGVNMTALTDSASDPAGTLVNAGGLLAPGDIGTPGQTSVTGNYACSNNASLAIDVNGPTPANAFTNSGADYDDVAVSGAASLGGNLVVRTNGLYVPSATSSFAILSAGSVSGTFANVTGGKVAVAGSTQTFDVVYTANSVILTNFSGAVSGGGTAPTNVKAAFVTVGGVPSVIITGTGGSGNCSVVTNSNLAAPINTWQPIATGLPQPLSYTNSVVPGQSTLFYRVRVP